MDTVFAQIDQTYIDQVIGLLGLFPAGIVLGVIGWGVSYLVYSLLSLFKA